MEAAPVSEGELKLANQLIEQLATKRFDPNEYVDEHRGRVEAAIQRKVEGKEVSISEAPTFSGGCNVVDLMEALKASLNARGSKARRHQRAEDAEKGTCPRGRRLLPRNRLGDEMQEYSLADLRRLFGLPPALIRKLGEAGCITQAAARGKSQYTFQDLLVLRVAGALKAAKISSPKIAAALGQIRAGSAGRSSAPGDCAGGVRQGYRGT